MMLCPKQTVVGVDVAEHLQKENTTQQQDERLIIIVYSLESEADKRR